MSFRRGIVLVFRIFSSTFIYFIDVSGRQRQKKVQKIRRRTPRRLVRSTDIFDQSRGDVTNKAVIPAICVHFIVAAMSQR